MTETPTGSRRYRANALFDAHRDDPEFGYRYLHEEAADAGQVMAERTAWSICSQQGWWSTFGKKRAKNGKKPGPPVHDDRCAVVDKHGVTRHVFTADAPNQLWLADITEHWTGEGKLYLCAVKDVYSNRIVGYSIDSRMKSRLAVAALSNAVARRGDVAGCMHPHGSRIAISQPEVRPRPGTATAWSDRWAASAPAVTTRPWRASSPCSRRTSSTAAPGPPAKSCGSRSSPGAVAAVVTRETALLIGWCLVGALRAFRARARPDVRTWRASSMRRRRGRL